MSAQSAGGSEMESCGRLIPAQFTKPSSRPKRSTAARTALPHSSGSVISHGTAMAWPPEATMPAAFASAWSALRSAMTIRAPASARRALVSAPMPLAPPVTRMTLSFMLGNKIGAPRLAPRRELSDFRQPDRPAFLIRLAGRQPHHRRHAPVLAVHQWGLVVDHRLGEAAQLGSETLPVTVHEKVQRQVFPHLAARAHHRLVRIEVFGSDLAEAAQNLHSLIVSV